MESPRPIPFVDLGIIALCGWQAFPGLVDAWRHAPFDRLGWLAFGLWAAPVIYRAVRPPRESRPGLPALAWVALGLLLCGSLADVNALCNLALAAAIGGFMPRHQATLAWLALSVAWMPALGWAGATVGAVALNALRALLGAAALWAGLRALSPPSPLPP
jgi:hypothetical protein